MTLHRLYVSAVIAASLLIANSPVSAQTEVPTEVVTLFDEINDIDKLRVINALKLTNDQRDSIIEALKQFRAAYNKVLVDTVVPPLREISKEVKETRGKMLKGGSVPPDLDEKVKKIQAAYVKKRDTVEFNTLKGMSETIKKILTSSQFLTAADLARKGTTVDGKPTARGDDDKFFNLFILNVFLRYPRILTLLEDVKKSQAAAIRPRFREARR